MLELKELFSDFMKDAMNQFIDNANFDEIHIKKNDDCTSVFLNGNPNGLIMALARCVNCISEESKISTNAILGGIETFSKIYKKQNEDTNTEKDE